ncbi:epididymal secretory protein e1 [Plakobranchus ocellatus]|uniref:Epididymal secretory protein e1 n=1 Tax=Plakobranchus ocellatus TaxID=259542 RepID=A0AAV3ZUW4_9GAST|nr:epididymal secretory protein e1 [Plakobranchus ocellatus]
MNPSTVLTVLCLGLAVAAAENIPIKDCGSKLATITAIDISPCPQIPCPFKRGTTGNITVNFTSKAEITNATSVVHGIIAGVPVPFPLKDKNACHNMKCPIQIGDKVVYKNGVPVLKSYPTIEVLVKYEIVSAGQDVICFTVPVQITA